MDIKIHVVEDETTTVVHTVLDYGATTSSRQARLSGIRRIRLFRWWARNWQWREPCRTSVANISTQPKTRSSRLGLKQTPSAGDVTF